MMALRATTKANGKACALPTMSPKSPTSTAGLIAPCERRTQFANWALFHILGIDKKREKIEVRLSARCMNQWHRHIRLNRRNTALTQQDIAHLLGFRAASHVSRLESGEREPDFRTALAFEIIFDKPVHDLFPAVCAELEGIAGFRAQTLLDRLRSETIDGISVERLQTLSTIAMRASHLTLDYENSEAA